MLQFKQHHCASYPWERWSTVVSFPLWIPFLYEVVATSHLPLCQLMNCSSFEKLFHPSKSTSFSNEYGCTQQGKKPLYFFFSFDFDCQSHVLSLKCLLLSPCMGHYFWNHPWWRCPLLPFKTCISQNCKGRGFYCSWSFYIFVLPCDSEILQLLSSYFILTLLLLAFGT